MSTSQDVHSQPPDLVYRWLHGGPELDDLTAVPLASTSASSNVPSVYRSFTDQENVRLEKAWQSLEHEERERAWRTKSVKTGERTSGKSSAASSRRGSAASLSRPSTAKTGAVAKPEQATPGQVSSHATQSSSRSTKEGESAVEIEDDQPSEEGDTYGDSYIADPEHEDQPHIVHVSQDSLFSADVRNWSLYPVFWKGSRIGIQRATWFYSTTSPSKVYPVDALLAHHLEEAFHETKPYDTSYEDELRSAVEFGQEAEAKLRHTLADVGVDAIFQGKDSARIYARHLPARLSKSFLTSLIRDKGHPGGGTLVYRGWDTVLKAVGPEASGSGRDKTSQRPRSDVDNTMNDSPRTRPASASCDSVEHQAPPDPSASISKGTSSFEGGELKDDEAAAKSAMAGFFNFGRFVGRSQRKDGSRDPNSAEKGDSNTTAEALEDDKGDEGNEPELAELVLVIHGIGQKLAVTYESFNIVHAINQLRKLCNKKGRDPAVSQLVGNKRLQFIPLQWRSSLQFEEMEKDSVHDATFDNQFTLDDVQVQGSIPFVRSLVTGVGLDLAFYLSHHRDKMTASVVRDANAIYRLFCKRNPSFKGKVSLIAHSLGTALATDILSCQPTFVPENPSPETRDKHFEFDVSSLFFLGSPVAYMFFLNRGQLIPRKGRARSKDVPDDVALDKAGRYGCMAIDNLYNVYNLVDPVACCLNACVDSEYAKVVKPQPVHTITSSLLSDYTAKVSSFLGSIMSTFGAGAAANADKLKEKAKDQVKEDPKADTIEPKSAPKPERPRTKRQATSEMDNEELRRFQRAEARMLALNPQGNIDFFLTSEGFSEYYSMLLSHASYWHDARFATFVVTQLLSSSEAIEKGREKLEEAMEKEAARAGNEDAQEADVKAK